MSRREELEKEIDLTQKKIDEASSDIPKLIKDAWIKELDSLSFELNNLYDDDEEETPD